MSSLNKRISSLEQQKDKQGHKSVMDMTDSELYEIIRKEYPDFPDLSTLSDSELRERIKELQYQQSGLCNVSIEDMRKL